MAGAGMMALGQTNGTPGDYSPAGTNITQSAASQPNAPAAQVRELSLQDCIELTLRHNVELQIDRYNPQIALFALRAAYGAYDPLLTLSGQHDNSTSGPQLVAGNLFSGTKKDDNNFSGLLNGMLPWGTIYNLQGNAIDTYGMSSGSPIQNASSAASINATQPLLKNFWIDSARLAIRTDKNNLKSSQEALKLQVMQTATAVEKAYYDLLYSRQNVLVQEKAVELAESLVKENTKRLEVGALAPLDLASAEAQAAQSRAAVFAARSQLDTQERVVKQLITDQFTEWADVVLIPSGVLSTNRQSFNRQQSWTKALLSRPEMVEARLAVENAGIQLKYNRNQLWPELDAFATYGFNGAGTAFSGALYDIQQTDKPFYTFGGKITLPLANLGARNNYKSSKLTLQQAVLTVKKWERDIMIGIDNDIGTVLADFDQVQATHTQHQYEQQALDAEQKKLENGKSTTYTVLQVQRDLTAARGAEIQAMDTYNKDLAQLSLDEASTLERLRIDLDVR